MPKQQAVARRKPNIADGVELSVLAIRENIMEYYKGSAIDRCATNTNIRLSENHGRWSHHFERDQIQLENEYVLSLDSVVLFNLKQQPDRFTVYATMDRSKSFRAIKESVLAFMEKHLPGVEVELSKEGSKQGWQGDRARVLANAPTQAPTIGSEAVYDKISVVLDVQFRDTPEGEVYRYLDTDYIRHNGRWQLHRNNSGIRQLAQAQMLHFV